MRFREINLFKVLDEFLDLTLCVLGLTGSANLYSRADSSTVRTNSVAALFGVTSDENGNFGIFLKSSVLLKNHTPGIAL